jgi:hypothetical protein
LNITSLLTGKSFTFFLCLLVRTGLVGLAQC